MVGTCKSGLSWQGLFPHQRCSLEIPEEVQQEDIRLRNKTFMAHLESIERSFALKTVSLAVKMLRHELWRKVSWFKGQRGAWTEIAISLYDALWWTDQLAKPDPMMERDDTRSSVERKLELCVGSANVCTLSPATDEPEVHTVRRRVLADAFT